MVEVDSSDDEPLIESVGKARIRLSDETSAASPKPKDQNNRVQRESRLLTTKQPSTATTATTAVTVGKDRLRATSVSSNESLGEVTTRRSVRQNTASPLATPASNTRGASRSSDDINRRKTRSGAAGTLF